MSRIALIAAVARNGAIGVGGGLPWRLPSDLKRFKALTMGKPLIIGRKTYDSIGRPLPGRYVIVLTRDAAWTAPGVTAAPGLEAALTLAAGADEILIGGGAAVYAEAMPAADTLYLTEVDLAPIADARFPDLDPAQWRETRRERGERGPKDEAEYAFVDYVRR